MSPSTGIENHQDSIEQCPICDGTRLRVLKRFKPHNIVECGNCTHAFVASGSSDNLRELYTHHYHDKEASSPGEPFVAREPQARYEAQLRAQYVSQFQTPSSLLEVGSADGVFLDEMRKAGFTVQGVEPGVELIKHCEERFDLDVFPGMIEEFSSSDNSFETIAMWHSLEHMPEPRKIVERLYRILAPGGFLFVEVPNSGCVAAKRRGANWYALDPQFHLMQFNRESLRILFENSGFKLVHFETRFPWHYLRRKLRPKNVTYITQEILRNRSPKSVHTSKGDLLRMVVKKPGYDSHSSCSIPRW